MKKYLRPILPFFDCINWLSGLFVKHPTRLHSNLFPYKFNKLRYRETFLCRDSSVSDENLQDAKKVVYCFWTGDNELSENRRKSIEQLRKNIGVPIKLITPKNLDEYILPDHPLHPAYKYLSYVHRADYLRCYFMHHHGGGYIDIKECFYSWEEMFDVLNSSDSYILGYPEKNRACAAFDSVNDVISKDVKNYWRYLIGNCAYICRPYTKFTDEWYRELLCRMDYFARDLEKNPGDITRNDNIWYPIKWTYILGCIFHPLCLKYHDRIIQSKVLRIKCTHYR